jgi:hypothetical protein
LARPTKLTAEVAEAIVIALRAGAPRGLAARNAGVSEPTFYRWLAEGREQAKGPKRKLLDAVEQAEAKAELHAVACWRSAMKDNWHACERYLERRHPEEWSRHRLAHDRRFGTPTAFGSGDSGAPLDEQLERLLGGGLADLTKLSDPQLRQLERLRRAARR